MRHLAEVIYYQLYRFYEFISIKRIVDPEPYETAFGTFGLFLGFFIFNVINFIWYFVTQDWLLSHSLNSIYGVIDFSIIGSGFVISYQLFMKKKRYIQIVKKKPLFKNSVPLSIFITIMYMIIFGFSFGWGGLIYAFFFK